MRLTAARTPAPWGPIGLVLVAMAVAVVVLGCVGVRLDEADLPEAPIAFLHWADTAANKRQELFAKAGELPPTPGNPEDPARTQELEIRIHLRGEISPILKQQLSKYPGRMMLLWPRSGRLERIDAAPRDAIPLAWSPDRSRLLFASTHRGAREQLYEYHLDRKDLSPVTTGPAEHPRGDYRRAGGLVIQRIRRLASVGPSRQTLHLAEISGRLGRSIARDVPPGMIRLSPKGDTVVYEQVVPRPRNDGPTTYVSKIASRGLAPGSRERLLADGREPSWTPDGQWIVFASKTSAGYRLRRMRPDGSSRVPIGPGGTEERMPSVSPDGEFIAFIQSDGGGRQRLAVRRFDGKDDRVLYSKGWSEFPVW